VKDVGLEQPLMPADSSSDAGLVIAGDRPRGPALGRVLLGGLGRDCGLW